jgi:hypothetical protein
LYLRIPAYELDTKISEALLIDVYGGIALIFEGDC